MSKVFLLACLLSLSATAAFGQAHDASSFARSAMGLAGGANADAVVMDVIEPKSSPEAAIVKIKVQNGSLRTYLFRMNSDGTLRETKLILNPRDLVRLNRMTLLWVDSRAQFTSKVLCDARGGGVRGASDGVNLICSGGTYDGFYIPVSN